MDSNIIDQDKTSTNYENDNLELNPALKINQDTYYPPPQPIYYPNENNQMPQNQPINYPVNNYNQQFIQPTPPPVYNPPLGVKVEQNISYIPHKSISQPQTNIYLIKINKRPLYYYCLPFLLAIFFLFIGLICLITGKSLGAFCFLSIIVFLTILLGIYNCLELNYKFELILGDSHLTVINKSFCCRQRISIYNKNELIGFDIRSRIEERHIKGGRTVKVNVYDFILLFRNGRNEKIITADVSLFTREETNYLLYYINDYIKN